MLIAIVCNSRAERGPLESVIAALPEARVVGMARDEQCGVPPWVMAKGLEYFSDVLRGSSLVILLGDRYETLAAALAATFLRIPIAHIHGGETTTGAFDDAFRHSITHLTESGGGLHFAATARAANHIPRILGRGDGELFSEHYRGVHLVGAPGLDGVPGNSARRDRKLILVTYHPETMAEDYGLAGCKAMLAALEHCIPEYDIWFCGCNADPGGDKISEAIYEFDARLNTTNCTKIRSNFSHDTYIGHMQSAALVIGNSSAGVIEAPWIGVPTVDIGGRQHGRECAPSVFGHVAGDLTLAIKTALAWRGPWEPVYRGGAAPKIAAVCRAFVEKRNGA